MPSDKSADTIHQGNVKVGFTCVNCSYSENPPLPPFDQRGELKVSLL